MVGFYPRSKKVLNSATGFLSQIKTNVEQHDWILSEVKMKLNKMVGFLPEVKRMGWVDSISVLKTRGYISSQTDV